jgi:hypothetical protein
VNFGKERRVLREIEKRPKCRVEGCVKIKGEVEFVWKTGF